MKHNKTIKMTLGLVILFATIFIIYCLDYNEMNFYLNGLETVLYSTDPDGICPSGYTFVNVVMFGDYCFGNIDNVHIIEHGIYGKIEYVNHAPDSL